MSHEIVSGFRFVVLEDGRVGAFITAAVNNVDPRTYKKRFAVLGNSMVEARARAAEQQGEGQWQPLFGRDLTKAKAHTFSAIKEEEKAMVEQELDKPWNRKKPLG